MIQTYSSLVCNNGRKKYLFMLGDRINTGCCDLGKLRSGRPVFIDALRQFFIWAL